MTVAKYMYPNFSGIMLSIMNSLKIKYCTITAVMSIQFIMDSIFLIKKKKILA